MSVYCLGEAILCLTLSLQSDSGLSLKYGFGDAELMQQFKFDISEAACICACLSEG